MGIDKKRCTIVIFPQKSMEIVVLSLKIDGVRCILYQKQQFVCGGPQKSQTCQAKTQLLQIRSTPIALAAFLPDLLIQL